MIRPENERFSSLKSVTLLVKFDGRWLALTVGMRDRSALMIAIVIAGVIFVVQLFVKQNLFSSTNIEAAGKLHQIFKAGDILPLLETSQNTTTKPDHKPCTKMSSAVMQHKELSECPYALLQAAEHNKAISLKNRIRARKS
jgi:hypothetical protein